jgi:NADH-quinone oxidoreductase subunit F
MMIEQLRIITKNFDRYTPFDYVGFMGIDGFETLIKALRMNKEDIIVEIEKSGLPGRGGAAYPAGRKLRQSAAILAKEKFIICNADEGEPATFKDRMILEKDIYTLIEGMIIAGFVVNATKGYIYLREEYRRFVPQINNALEKMRLNGFLGENILDSGYSLDVEVFLGAGAYICGEGTALIESMEGHTGRPRAKPPYTKQNGLFYKPTLLHNVETLAAIKAIIRDGYQTYRACGTDKSPGPKLVSLSGNINNPGFYEVPCGGTTREVIYELGGGIKNGREFGFLQLGGNPGPILKENFLDVPIAYCTFEEWDVSLGSGSLLVVDDQYDIFEFMDAVQSFFVHESCGKCTPCRKGNTVLLNIINKLKNGTATRKDIVRIREISELMKSTSLCGLGKTASIPILSVLENFKEEVESRIID